jgi:hypothetical protein
LLPALTGKGQAREADTFGSASHDLLGELDALDQIVLGIEMQQWHEPSVDAQGL